MLVECSRERILGVGSLLLSRRDIGLRMVLVFLCILYVRRHIAIPLTSRKADKVPRSLKLGRRQPDCRHPLHISHQRPKICSGSLLRAVTAAYTVASFP
jgi:hypothetical protein